MTGKVCSVCKQLKPLESFAKQSSSKDKLQGQCRECCKNWRKEYYKKFPERNRKRSIKNNYGIDMDRLESMYERQGGKCGICKQSILLFATNHKESIGVGRVDHDHKTGAIRGLLCHKCNIGLGHFEDNIVSLRNAVSYLEEFKDD
jgi:Recombination endonuclease VII